MKGELTEAQKESKLPPIFFFKTAAEKADAVSAFINTARLVGGRATFMAGFAYYSVSEELLSSCAITLSNNQSLSSLICTCS